MNPLARPRLFSSMHGVNSFVRYGRFGKWVTLFMLLAFLGLPISQEDTLRWRYLKERYPPALHGVEAAMPWLPWEYQGLSKLFLWVDSCCQWGSQNRPLAENAGNYSRSWL
jgi:hypothetical protein